MIKGLFKVNTGLREQEVCGLKWTDEVEVPELNTSVFIIEGDKVKNEADRLVVLNRVARSVIDSVRGQHPEYVFVRMPKPRKAKPGCERAEPEPCPVKKMNSTAWKNGRERAANKLEEQTGQPAPAGFRRVRVHDLKHTFGRRLRAAGVSFEDRGDTVATIMGACAPTTSRADAGEIVIAIAGTRRRRSHSALGQRRHQNVGPREATPSNGALTGTLLR
jgi:integrase